MKPRTTSWLYFRGSRPKAAARSSAAKPGVVSWLCFGWLAAAPLAGLGCGEVLGIEERTLMPLCERYCSEVMETCSGAYQLYASPETCMGTCAQLAAGAEGDTEGNTVECRRSQVQRARQTLERGEHCRRAGPGGDGVCGTNCEGFCAVVIPVCGVAAFGSNEECLAVCSAVPDHGDYHVPVPEEDSIQCRLYHATSATIAGEHCAHARGDLKCVASSETGSGGGGGNGSGGTGGGS